MTTPQGWYDDGSGNLRWWDGNQWAAASAPAPSTVPGVSAFPASVPGAQEAIGEPLRAPQRKPTLGIIALVLALLGTALAVIPTVAHAHGFVMVIAFAGGIMLMLAALVFAVIGLVVRTSRKWPAGAGAGLSVVGGIAATVVFVSGMFGTPLPDAVPTQEPDVAASPSTDAGRPSAAEIQAFFAQHVLPMENQSFHEFIYECMGEDLYESDLTDEDLRSLLEIDDEATLRSLVEENPECAKNISTIVDGDIHGAGTAVSIGGGLTVQITVRAGQLREPDPILPGQPVTDEDYGYSWGDAVETGGHVAVVTITVRNNGETASDNGAFFSLQDPSGESIVGSTGMFGTLDYPSDPFNINNVAPGEEKTFTKVYAVSADDIGQTSADVYVIRNMGSGSGFIIR